MVLTFLHTGIWLGPYNQAFATGVVRSLHASAGVDPKELSEVAEIREVYPNRVSAPRESRL